MKRTILFSIIFASLFAWSFAFAEQPSEDVIPPHGTADENTDQFFGFGDFSSEQPSIVPLFGVFGKGRFKEFTLEDIDGKNVKVVLDRRTNLVWQKYDSGRGKTADEDWGGKTWFEAKDYCNNMTVGNVGNSESQEKKYDWRVPTILELDSIMNRDSKTVLDKAFIATPLKLYRFACEPPADKPFARWCSFFATEYKIKLRLWSSTPHHFIPYHGEKIPSAWCIYICPGELNGREITDKYLVRCIANNPPLN